MRRHSQLALVSIVVTASAFAMVRTSVRAAASVTPRTMRRIATVDPRFQSYNVEMAEVIGGNFWKPYDRQDDSIKPATAAPQPPPSAAASQPAGLDPSMFQARPPIDLTNARLRKLAAAIGPAYMRTSGSWANMVYFHDADTPPPSSAPKGFQGVLTRAQWKAVVDFAHAANARLVSSFTVSQGVRDPSGVWTPDQARRLVAYTKTAGGDIAAAEFFNEPNIPAYGGAPPGYAAADYARDFALFRAFAKTSVPRMQIVGPGSVGEGTMMQGTGTVAGLVKTEDILSASPQPVVDIFSYHHYGAVSRRCAAMGGAAQTTAAAALSDEWLSRTDASYTVYAALRDRFARGAPIWITETAESACGGNPWAAEFLDTFRYLDQLGRLARRGVNVIFHNTLAASEYALLDPNTFTPRPNYWAALLWHRLMGRTVLDAGASQANLHLYAQCLPGRAGGVTLLAINTSRTQNESFDLSSAADRYTLTAPGLDATTVQLNGRELKLQSDDALPDLQSVRVPAGPVTFAPATITFLAVRDAGNGSCRN